MPAEIRLDESFLTGIWIGTLLYGVNAVIFVGALIILLRKRAKAGKGFLFLIVTSIFLFLLSTAYVGICFRQLLEAFVFGPPGGAIAYFAYEPNPLAISKLVLLQINVSAQNMILIWRLWVVFGNKWAVVVLPIVLECIHLASGFISVARGSHPNVPVFDPIIHRWSLVYWSIDLVVNIGVTFLLAYRIWTVGHGLRVMGGDHGHRYLGVMLTIIESGAIFATATAVLVGMFLAGNPAIVTALDSVVQLASISPMLIVVRVGLALHHGSSVNTMSTNMLSTGVATAGSLRPSGIKLGTTHDEEGFGMDALRFTDGKNHSQVSV